MLLEQQKVLFYSFFPWLLIVLYSDLILQQESDQTLNCCITCCLLHKYSNNKRFFPWLLISCILILQQKSDTHYGLLVTCLYLYPTKEVFMRKFDRERLCLCGINLFGILKWTSLKNNSSTGIATVLLLVSWKLLCIKKSDVFKSCQNLSCITDSKVNIIQQCNWTLTSWCQAISSLRS